MTRDTWSGIKQLNEVERAIAAEAYARGDIPVFPLFGIVPNPDGGRMCECPAAASCDRPGKHPRVRWTKEATTDVDTVREWWTRWPNANIGVPTDESSGFTVIDLDLKEIEHEHLTDVISGEDQFTQYLERELGPGAYDQLEASTLVARSGGSGKHLVLRFAKGSTLCVGWFPAVDVKSEGGYFVVAPSLHVSGRRYEWLSEREPAEAPARLGDALRVARSALDWRGVGRTPDTPEYDYRRSKIDAPGLGYRDDFFNRYAFELRRRGWDRAAATEELRAIWERTPGGGASSGDGRVNPYRWETVAEKLQRVWNDVTVDPDAREPVTDELLAWARGGSGTTAPEAAGDGSASDGGGPPGGGGGTGRAGAGDPGPGAELATDLGTAQRFERVNAPWLRFVPGIGWLRWTGTHWRPDDSGEAALGGVRRVIADLRQHADRVGGEEAQRWANWALACESAGRIAGILKLAERHPGLVVDADRLDADPHLLNCPNGTLDLRTGELREHRQVDLITNVTGVELDRSAVSDILDDFHVTFLPQPAVRDYIYETLGLALWGGNRERRFVVITGDTSTGKSTWITGVRRALGTYAAPVNSSIFRGTLGDAPRPDLLHIVRKRLAIAEEGSRQWDLHTDQVKRITGGDSVVARKMRSDVMIERTPDFTPVVVTNEMPHIKDADDAIRRRILALPFNVRVRGEDPGRKDEFIRDEGVQRAILATLVYGFESAAARTGALRLEAMPPAVAEATFTAFGAFDDVAEFVQELRESGRLIEDSEAPMSSCVRTSELHVEYVQWVNLHGSAEDRRNRLGIKQFSQRLASMGWERVRSNGMRWVGKVVGMGAEHL